MVFRVDGSGQLVKESVAGGSGGQVGKGKAGDSPGAPELSFPEAQVLPE